MFGKNEIIGQKYFKEADQKYLVTSIFYTIQGEGPLAGTPSVFIRLAKCNLNCSFCDTYFDRGEWMTVEQIDKNIETLLHNYYGGAEPAWAVNRDMALILTGGEPMLQKIGSLLVYFNNTFQFQQVESNGTLLQDMPDSTILVVSPKCNEKTKRYMEISNKVLDRADALKFVISADPESEYHTIPDWVKEWKWNNPHKDVYISPMNMYNKEPQAAITASKFSNDATLEDRNKQEVISFWEPGLLNLEENRKNHEWAGKYALQHGYKVNLQQHLYLGMA